MAYFILLMKLFVILALSTRAIDDKRRRRGELISVSKE